MLPPTESAQAARARLAEAVGLLRPHIVCIAALAAAAFGVLFQGRPNWPAALWVGFDWLLLNFWNRLGDVAEDRLNRVPGAELAARHGRGLFLLALGLLLGSLVVTWPRGMAFTATRLIFQALGFAYNYRVLPGGTRFKDVLGLKNLSAGVLFVLSDLGYPLLLNAGPPALGASALVALAAFFLSLEMTYELFYDLRDLRGDGAAGISTIPVRFGEGRTRALIAGLLVLSASSLVVGYARHALGSLALLFLAAPLQQALVLALWLRTQVTARDAIRLTYLGAAQLASFLAWISLGLPRNPFGLAW